jgi:hypothetical protein
LPFGDGEEGRHCRRLLEGPGQRGVAGSSLRGEGGSVGNDSETTQPDGLRHLRQSMKPRGAHVGQEGFLIDAIERCGKGH